MPGRTFAYSLNSSRSRTFTDRKPPPTGVVSGPLSARRVRRMLSSSAGGSGSPVAAMAAMPPCCVSQTNGAPAAARTATTASVISGPMPSPGISVAGMGAEGVAWLMRVPDRAASGWTRRSLRVQHV